ncbi:MAG TPA: phospholipase D-like domain-containing protein, partial [Chloroflexota bacterium]
EIGDGSFTVRLMSLLSPSGAITRALPPEARDLTARRASIDNADFIRRVTALVSDSWRIAGGSGRTGGAGIVPLLVIGVIVAVFVVGVLLYLSRQQAPAAAPAQTAGGGSGWYQLYFTTPHYPDNVADHKGGLDEKLTAFIDSATKSVDMAIYQLDLDNVTRAMLDAKGRGATVRVVTDIDILNDPKENPSFKKLQAAGITVVGGNPNAIMHDKFVVVDEKAVWMGSWNFTTNDTYRYNNNGILIQSPELARNYTATFEKMWRDRKFGAARKSGGTTPSLTISGVAVESYFAPENGVAEKIVNRLKGAAKTIDFMAFSFTDDEIGATVRGRAKAGVKVRGVFEKTGSETQFSEFPKMKAAGLDVLQDGNPYLMHHKVFVVDGKTTVLGSFNFSQNAETANDENLIIVDDQGIAGLFTQEFERVQAQAKSPPNAKDGATGSEKESQNKDK